MEGFPWDDLRKIFIERVKVPSGVEKNFNRLSRVHERYRQQTTDRRTIAYSEREREFVR